MKRFMLVIICLFTSVYVFGQAKKLDLGSDTAISFQTNIALAIKLGLPELKKSQHKCNYRFWTYGQILDFWSDDDTTYHGSVMNYIYRIKRKGNFIVSKEDLTTTGQAWKFVSLYKTLNLAQIPSERKIPNWSKGFDGETISIEYADPDNYSYKDYWEPSDQKSPMGIIVGTFYEHIKAELNLDQTYKKFLSALPYGKYNIGMMILHIYPSPKKAKGGSYLF